MLHLSKAGKMPCRSWSLQAGSTCPGSIDPKTKQPVEVCSGCYAKLGNYNYSHVKTPRENNRLDWIKPDWVDRMIAELDNDRYFRWFDSGDVYHPKLAEKIYLVMKNTPWVKHWLPTKSYKVAKIKPWLAKMKRLPNVTVRYSADSINGKYNRVHGSTVIPSIDYAIKAFVCQSYKNDGQCGPCRACWDKSIPVVAYVAHGVVLKSKLKNAA
jgi:hypothetical protein